MIAGSFAERCRSGRTGRSRKPLYLYRYPGFESLSLRHSILPSDPYARSVVASTGLPVLHQLRLGNQGHPRLAWHWSTLSDRSKDAPCRRFRAPQFCLSSSDGLKSELCISVFVMTAQTENVRNSLLHRRCRSSIRLDHMARMARDEKTLV